MYEIIGFSELLHKINFVLTAQSIPEYGFSLTRIVTVRGSWFYRKVYFIQIYEMICPNT